jgi:hypothetical protein
MCELRYRDDQIILPSPISRPLVPLLFTWFANQLAG